MPDSLTINPNLNKGPKADVVDSPNSDSKDFGKVPDASNKKDLHHDIPDLKKLNSAETDLDFLELPKIENPEIPKAKKVKKLRVPDDGSLLAKFINNNFISNIVPTAFNMGSLVLNVISAIGDAIPASEDSPFKKFTSMLGQIGMRGFIFTNASYQFLEQVFFKNYASAAAYLCENIIAAKVKKPVIYLARGFIVGTYTIVNSLRQLMGRDRFDNLEDHISVLKQGLVKSFGLLKEDIQGVFKYKDSKEKTSFVQYIKDHGFLNLRSAKTGLMGTLAGIAMWGGSSLWALGGGSKATTELATKIRDIAGLFCDAEKLKPRHLELGRKFFWLSGASYIFGTISDLFKNTIPGTKNLFVSLNAIADVAGRMFLREADVRGEMK